MSDELLTDEDIQYLASKCSSMIKLYGTSVQYYSRADDMRKAINTIKQLQKEKAGMLSLRIEQATALGKAAEAIAVFRVELSKTKADLTDDGFCVDCHVHISEPADHLSHCYDRTWACDHTEELAKAYRQKLCDEIVGKIEAKYDEGGKLIHYQTSIDIVKSVLVPYSIDDWVAQKSTIPYSENSHAGTAGWIEPQDYLGFIVTEIPE